MWLQKNYRGKGQNTSMEGSKTWAQKAADDFYIYVWSTNGHFCLRMTNMAELKQRTQGKQFIQPL